MRFNEKEGNMQNDEKLVEKKRKNVYVVGKLEPK